MHLLEHPGARAVQLVDPLEIEHHVRGRLLEDGLDLGRQELGGPEEDGALELEDDDLSALDREQLHEARIPGAPRVGDVAAINPADDRLAHPQEEEEHRDRHPDRDPGDQVVDDRDGGHQEHDQEVEGHRLPVHEVLRDEAPDGLEAPPVQQLHGHHRERGRDHHPGDEPDDGGEEQHGQQQEGHCHGRGQPRSPARPVVGEGRAQIEASRDAAEAGRDHVPDPEHRQDAVAGDPEAGHALHRLRAQQRVERRDERERRGREEDRRHHRAEVCVGEDGEETRQLCGFRQSGRDPAHHRSQTRLKAEPGQPEIGCRAGDEAQDDRRDDRKGARSQPDGQPGEDPDRQGRQLDERRMGHERSERHVARDAEQCRQLGEENQHRDRILKAGHDRGRDVADEGSEPQQPEQGLRDPGHEDDEERERQRLATVLVREAAADGGGQQEGDEAARREHQRLAFTEEKHGERDEDCAVQAGKDGHREVLVSERKQREHAVPHAHRDREQGRGDPAHHVALQARQVEAGHGPAILVEAAEPVWQSRLMSRAQAWVEPVPDAEARSPSCSKASTSSLVLTRPKGPWNEIKVASWISGENAALPSSSSTTP